MPCELASTVIANCCIWTSVASLVRISGLESAHNGSWHVNSNVELQHPNLADYMLATVAANWPIAHQAAFISQCNKKSQARRQRHLIRVCQLSLA